MTGRRRKSTKRAASVTMWRPWSPAFSRIFRLAGDDMTPPTQIKVRQGRTITWTAIFTQPDGRPVELAVRVDPVKRLILDERATFVFKMRGAAK